MEDNKRGIGLHLSHSDLRELKKRGDVNGLIDVLNTGDLQEKRDAAFILGELKSSIAVKPLIRFLKKDDIHIRANAAWALGEIGDLDAVLPLIELLYDTSQNVQLHAAWSLGRIGDEHAIPDLFAAMKNGSPEFRRVAKDAIDRIESEAQDAKQPHGESLPESIDIPLVTLNLPDGFEIKYPVVMEGASRRPGDNIINISDDVIIKDTGDGNKHDIARRIILGLKDHNKGEVLIDILFKYKDSTSGETRTGSLWLQVASAEKQQTKRKEGEDIRNAEPHRQEIRPPAPEVPVVKLPEKKEENMDSAVRMLSDIGLSGVAKAASAVNQLSGQEETGQSQLRTLPVDQMHDEIINLGDSVVLVEVKLHGRSAGGDMNGKMQLYISKDTGLSIANELLCNPPDAFCREFTEDIISTLRETANIFGGQYISAISEYIGFPILLGTPEFKSGPSSQIAESVMKEVKGKVEFVLATDLALGKDKTGRLVMLLDQKSFDVIISKLF